MSKFKLLLKKYLAAGNLSWEYNPLRNVVPQDKQGSEVNQKELSTFDTKELTFDIDHPVDIECQPAYDGSVNLILNDDYNPPRLVNSAFSVTENNTYKRIRRNQKKQTNYYRENQIESESRLQRSTSTVANIDLKSIDNQGNLSGGNYIFYFRYIDDDENESRIFGESGLVSIFKGTSFDITSCTGTLEKQNADKSVTLTLSNLDDSYNSIQVLYSLNFSDLNGIKQTEYYKINKKYKFSGTSATITITGDEEKIQITRDVLNIRHNIYNTVKTTAQVQNILFFGNVSQPIVDDATLQQLSYQIQVQCIQKHSLGKVNTDYTYTGDSEYYNPYNIYNYLGYMPGEFYRLGVVYIFNDDSLSDVYNLRGCLFSKINELNFSKVSQDALITIDPTEDIINAKTNSKGVFRIPQVGLQKNNQIYPIGFKMNVSDDIKTKLHELKIKGYFFVRQKRIPIFLTQTCSIGVSTNAYTPLLSFQKIDDEGKLTTHFLTQSIFKPVDLNNSKDTQDYYLKPYYLDTTFENSNWNTLASINGLLSTDVILNPSLQSLLDGSMFKLKASTSYNINNDSPENIKYNYIATPFKTTINTDKIIQRSLVYVPQESPYYVHKSYKFSTKAGSSVDVKTLRNLRWDAASDGKRMDQYTVRGNYVPFIGVCGESLEPNVMYNVYTLELPERQEDLVRIIEKRGLDKSEFTLIGKYNTLDTQITELYGGDCFTNTTSLKIQSNFLDHNTPLNNLIVKPKVTLKNYSEVEDWNDFNTSDWNAVGIGYVFTYNNMSNFHTSVRSINRKNTDEMALFGGARTFFPYTSFSNTSTWKLPESTLLNGGLSTTQGSLLNYNSEIVPYKKELFENRIAFSEFSNEEYFKNGYRVFKSLQYRDIERQYGAIVKLEPLGTNLFCVFEHGCGIININEQGLINTENKISVHLYGLSVLPQQIQVVSPDYGSIWEESIIKTPSAIYGVDTFAKKIWRYTANGFEIISDQLTQRFLNDNLDFEEADVTPTIAYKNVKSHYNNYKGDVMFTFYNGSKTWNLCFNERISKWVTRYSWTPLYSANIQNSYLSVDKEAVSLYTAVLKNMNLQSGLKLVPEKDEFTSDPLVATYTYRPSIDEENNTITTEFRRSLDIVGFADMYNHVRAFVKSISYPEYNPKDGTFKIITIDSTQFTQYEDSSSYLVGWGNSTNSYNSQSAPENYADKAFYKVTNETAFYESFENAIQITFDAEAELNVKLNCYAPWIKLNMNVEPARFALKGKKEKEKLENIDLEEYKKTSSSLYGSPEFIGTPFDQQLTFIANFESVSEALTKYQKDEEIYPKLQEISDSLDAILRVNLFTHGRAGTYDEIDYFDENESNQIKPTFWYKKQEPFELEFVVNTSSGMQKIFNNLVIISNNAEPNSIEYEIIGDSYDFNKKNIFKANEFTKMEYNDNGSPNVDKYKSDYEEKEFNETDISQNFDVTLGDYSFPTKVEWDPILNQYSLIVKDSCRNIKDSRVKRMIGNIEYKEDRWNVAIRPIYFKRKLKKHNRVEVSKNAESARLRDKWMKVRIRYKGDKLVVIAAIQTLLTISFN